APLRIEGRPARRGDRSARGARADRPGPDPGAQHGSAGAAARAGRDLASRLPPDPPAGDARRRIGERGAPRPVPDGATAEGPRARPGELLRGPRRAWAAA